MTTIADSDIDAFRRGVIDSSSPLTNADAVAILETARDWVGRWASATAPQRGLGVIDDALGGLIPGLSLDPTPSLTDARGVGEEVDVYLAAARSWPQGGAYPQTPDLKRVVDRAATGLIAALGTRQDRARIVGQLDEDVKDNARDLAKKAADAAKWGAFGIGAVVVGLAVLFLVWERD